MALGITNDCINCESCIDVCPTNAISQVDNKICAINPDLCTECAGYKEEPQCMEICPVDAVIYSWALKKMNHSCC